MDESRSLTRKEPVAVLVYRTHVPAHLWYDPQERAVLIERLEYDASLVRDGVILLISVVR
jgi:hypothetical protein